MKRHHKIQAAVGVVALSLLVATSALASTPQPGTVAQVAALVKAAPKIKLVPKTLEPILAKANNDQANLVTPALNKCVTTSSGTTITNKCLFGDTTGKKTMVLWGDSHAEMWFPALNAIAKTEKWKLVALFDLGCPVANVATMEIDTSIPNVNCSAWRTNMLTRINALDPQLVVISESWYTELASGTAMTTTAWEQGVVTTLKALDSKGTKKAVIGDTIFPPGAVLAAPSQCVSEHPTNVQLCDKTDSPTLKSERLADADAAAAASSLYINEVPWECSTVCSPIIGHYFVYWGTGHLTVTYDLYLTKVLQNALKSDL